MCELRTAEKKTVRNDLEVRRQMRNRRLKG